MIGAKIGDRLPQAYSYRQYTATAQNGRVTYEVGGYVRIWNSGSFYGFDNVESKWSKAYYHQAPYYYGQLSCNTFYNNVWISNGALCIDGSAIVTEIRTSTTLLKLIWESFPIQ